MIFSCLVYDAQFFLYNHLQVRKASDAYYFQFCSDCFVKRIPVFRFRKVKIILVKNASLHVIFVFYVYSCLEYWVITQVSCAVLFVWCMSYSGYWTCRATILTMHNWKIKYTFSKKLGRYNFTEKKRNYCFSLAVIKRKLFKCTFTLVYFIM